MSRRFGRRNARGGRPGGGGGTAVSAFDTAINATLPYSFMRMDAYSVDGVSGKIASLSEKVAAGTGIKAVHASHAYVQATPAKQIVTPAASANLGNSKAGLFTGAEYYQSNAPPSAWRCLHDGTGCEVFIVISKTGGGNYLVLSTTAIGSGLWWQTTANITANIYTAGSYVVYLNAAATWATDKYFSYQYSTAETPDASQFKRATAAGTDNSRLTPAAGDPTNSLVIGSNAVGLTPFVGEIASVIAWNRVLATGERASARAAIGTEFGVV